MMFNVGDVVQIRDWQEMEEEYGLNLEGEIDCKNTFTDAMEEYCGKVFTIKNISSDGDVDFEGEYIPYYFSTDMIKPYIEIKSYESLVIE